MFTQRAALLGFVAFCFYLIAVVNSLSGFYYALTWLSMAMLAASLGVALLSLVGVSCKLEVTRSRGAASLGDGALDGALVAMAISNVGTLNKTNIVLEIRVEGAGGARQTLRFLLEALPSGVAIDTVLPLTRLRRGSYHLVDARLVGSDVLGLFRTTKRVDFEAKSRTDFLIGPPVLRSEIHFESSGAGQIAGHRRTLITRRGEELRGTRPYAPGDDLRHVHWKSSARAGELVVKEWEQTGQASALVIWDGAQGTAHGAGDFDSGEWGLILCASLCHALLADGTPCDFARLDALPTLVRSRALVGGELPVELTEVLSGAVANRVITLEKSLHGIPNLGRLSDCNPILVSASLGLDLMRAVSGLRAQGLPVQVVLVNAGQVAARSGDRRFREGIGKIGVSKPVLQPELEPGAAEKSVALTAANFARQVARLRETSARVVSVGVGPTENAESALRAGLHLAGQKAGMERPVR